MDTRRSDEKAEAGQMFCTGCWRYLPSTQFRRRIKGTEKRHVRCTLCFNEYRRALAASRRGKRIGQFAQLVNHRHGDPRRIETAFIEITRVFGGIHRLAAYWREAVDRARDDGKHHLVARYLLAIANLGAGAATASVDQTNYELLSDEQLAQSVELSVRDLIAREPSVAIRAARDLGWQVIPPDEMSADSAGQASTAPV